MILYHGEVLDNDKQEELLDALKKDVYAPILRGESLATERVIAACDRLATKILRGEFDTLIDPFLSHFEVDEGRFQDMVRLFLREGLEYKCAIELRDDAKIIDGKVLRKRYPLGVLLHIAAGNLDVLPAYSVIEGLLAGNINILKLPTGDSGLSVRLLDELIRIEPALKEYVYVFDVPSAETDSLKKLAELADGVVVWGGDEAVKAARNMVDPNTKIIAWGHKLSFAYAQPDAGDEELKKLAREICRTNQLLCSSCQGIFVDTNSPQVQLEFARRFFEILKEADREARPVDYGMKAAGAIRLYHERLNQHKTGRQIFKEGGVSVLVCEDEELTLSYLYRNVWIKRLPFGCIGELKKYKQYLQTAAVLTGDRKMFEIIGMALAAIGVVRITSAENMSRSICGEAHDGTYALREYSRIVELEIVLNSCKNL
ncbi:MAG: acyl-CoA reductase [Lachnospiraceae bacterium]|nr:acyl-CoA reductase [Lachnospiraceae bacterium]